MLIGSIFIVLGMALGIWMVLRHRKDQHGGRWDGSRENHRHLWACPVRNLDRSSGSRLGFHPVWQAEEPKPNTPTAAGIRKW